MWRHRLVLSLLIVTPPTIAEEQRVGSLGDRQHWHIHGLESVEASKVLRRLSSDLPVQLAGHPQAPLADLPAVIEARLLIGLKHCGFRDARVTVRIDPSNQTIDIQVSEGTRFLAGNVVVAGVEGELADRIVASLTSSEVDHQDETPKFDSLGKVLEWVGNGAASESKKTVWKLDEPAPFDDVTLKGFKHQITRIIEDAGYGDAEFTVSIVQRDQFADLTIHIADLGLPSILSGIEVKGNWRDSDEEIADYLRANDCKDRHSHRR